jgi:hypothetical protein
MTLTLSTAFLKELGLGVLEAKKHRRRRRRQSRSNATTTTDSSSSDDDSADSSSSSDDDDDDESSEAEEELRPAAHDPIQTLLRQNTDGQRQRHLPIEVVGPDPP